MIIFDEKKYGERVYKGNKYMTLQNQGQERRAVARYLKYELEYTDSEIKKKVSKIKSKRKECFEDSIWNEIMDKVLEDYDNEEYIKDFKVGVSQTELDVILDQPTEECRNLLFVLLVYYKWSRLVQAKVCMRGDDVWVKEADLDCCKLAGLKSLRKQERLTLFNIFCSNQVYKSDYIRRYHNIFTLNFVDDKKPVIIIDDFEEILAHLENYINSERCCKCSKCGALIHKTSNNKQRCKSCTFFRKHKKGK